MAERNVQRKQDHLKVDDDAGTVRYHYADEASENPGALMLEHQAVGAGNHWQPKTILTSDPRHAVLKALFSELAEEQIAEL